MAEKELLPNYLFETSWEICNKAGGIHTALSTKALTFENEFKSNYMLLGPDVWRDDETSHPEFVEDKQLFKKWKDHALNEGLRIRTGRWNIAGNPIAIIIDFTTFIPQKDEIFSLFWENYKLDSLSGQWDYIEPALFGYSAGKTIESFVKFNLNSEDKIVAHFHEWLTGTGILYLKKFLPQVGTVFTLHSTVLGRALAADNRALYKNLEEYKADEIAREYNLISKNSLEKLSAHHADCFTTVSEITAKECKNLLQKEVNIITPNGFEESLVPSFKNFTEKRKTAREKLTGIAEALFGYKLSKNTVFIANGGKNEFRNKGIDVFIESLGDLNKNAESLDKEIVAFVLAPTSNFGPRKELLEKLNGQHKNDIEPYFTYGLHDHEYEFILSKIKEAGLTNSKNDKVKIVFISSYINELDGLFSSNYYDILIGFDFTIFPSYYEPFGYIPLESIAYGIPTLSSTLAGFGLWIKTNVKDTGDAVKIIERSDNDHEKAVEQTKTALLDFIKLKPNEYEAAKSKATEIAGMIQWKEISINYKKAYDFSLKAVEERSSLFVKAGQTQVAQPEAKRPVVNDPKWKSLMVQSNLPEKLKVLEEITSNLWWTWDIEATELLESINPELWENCKHNPVALFEQVEYGRLLEIEENNDFLAKLNDVYKRYKAYLDDNEYKATTPLIAYFSMEYGLHDTLKIYSGGLGLLAGDYLKEASDDKRNLVAIGLLYRYGYFRQFISVSGEQLSSYDYYHFSKLPIKPVCETNGSHKTISIMLPGRAMKARIWEVNVGRTKLYLLDTDFESNLEQDRYVTHHLYGGNNENRLKQELLLGIGGIRALQVLGYKPDLYHSNEGHSAFIGIERLRKYINENNLSYEEAKEFIRSTTLFTTHTPVPAGHDQFPEDLLRAYIAHYPTRLKISWDEFMNLGKSNPDDFSEKFNMSHLAANLSQEINGVSMLHGKVSQEMFAKLWKGYLPEELHLGYVTNGVHLPTWLSKEWRDLYFEMFGNDFYTNQLDKLRWEKIYDAPNEKLWKIKENQRKILIEHIKERFKDNWTQKHENPKLVMEITNAMDDQTLTIGFARRFATYKRAHLLFKNLDRLSKLVNNPEKPVQFLFAGKAHPHDKGGQALIKMIVEISKRPEFAGKIIFLQNYDIALAKKLVRGVDIWLNTPTRPLEASGTSGEKAVMNGSMHFSVLDGWWVEGYQKDAGWMLPQERTYENQELQDELDAEMVYSTFENEIVPAFYERNENNIPDRWIGYIKNSIAHVAPKFTTTRMIGDYYDLFYDKLAERSKTLNSNDYAITKEIVAWKKKIARNWDNIKIVSSVFSENTKEIYEVGKKYAAEVVLNTGNIKPSEIGVEIVITENKNNLIDKIEFELTEEKDNQAKYCAEIIPTRPGSYNYGFRLFPKNEKMPHRQDISFMKWL